jgi:hypothetical protein
MADRIKTYECGTPLFGVLVALDTDEYGTSDVSLPFFGVLLSAEKTTGGTPPAGGGGEGGLFFCHG